MASYRNQDIFGKSIFNADWISNCWDLKTYGFSGGIPPRRMLNEAHMSPLSKIGVKRVSRRTHLWLLTYATPLSYAQVPPINPRVWQYRRVYIMLIISNPSIPIYGFASRGRPNILHQPYERVKRAERPIGTTDWTKSPRTLKLVCLRCRPASNTASTYSKDVYDYKQQQSQPTKQYHLHASLQPHLISFCPSLLSFFKFSRNVPIDY
jgi:hypothetical protein